jgi:hypothetical protein
VLVVGVVTGLLAGVAAATQSCALHDFELAATSTGDAGPDVTTHPRHDAGADVHNDTGHDAGKKVDAKAHVEAKADTYVAPTVCTSKEPPAPPSGPDVPGNEVFTLALRTVDLGETDPVPPGYDLDHTDTCCGEAGPTCVSAKQHCDYAGGIDDNARVLMKAIEQADPTGFGSVAFSQEAEEGIWSLLIQLSGYAQAPDGGVADDPAVQVDLFPSPGTISGAPLWTGNDSWKVLASSVGDGGLANPLYRSLGAYVVNHVLVAGLPEMAVTMSGSGQQTITVTLTSGVLTGTLVPYPGGGFQISDGVIAGRWAEHNIFLALSSYRNDQGQPTCVGSFGYAIAKSDICDGLDLLADESQPPTLPCDSLSMGFGFTAVPILPLSTIVPPAVPSAGCPPATDPANDSCTAGADAGPDAHSDGGKHLDAHAG